MDPFRQRVGARKDDQYDPADPCAFFSFPQLRGRKGLKAWVSRSLTILHLKAENELFVFDDECLAKLAEQSGAMWRFMALSEDFRRSTGYNSAPMAVTARSLLKHTRVLLDAMPPETWDFIPRAAFLPRYTLVNSESSRFTSQKMKDLGLTHEDFGCQERIHLLEDEEDEVTAGNGTFSAIFLSADLTSHESLALQAFKRVFVGGEADLVSGTIEVKKLNDGAHKPDPFWAALTTDGLRLWVFMRHCMNANSSQKNKMLAALTWRPPCRANLTAADVPALYRGNGWHDPWTQEQAYAWFTLNFLDKSFRGARRSLDQKKMPFVPVGMWGHFQLIDFKQPEDRLPLTSARPAGKTRVELPAPILPFNRKNLSASRANDRELCQSRTTRDSARWPFERRLRTSAPTLSWPAESQIRLQQARCSCTQGPSSSHLLWSIERKRSGQRD